MKRKAGLKLKFLKTIGPFAFFFFKKSFKGLLVSKSFEKKIFRQERFLKIFNLYLKMGEKNIWLGIKKIIFHLGFGPGPEKNTTLKNGEFKF